jgi:serine/threonine-protein kinase
MPEFWVAGRNQWEDTMAEKYVLQEQAPDLRRYRPGSLRVAEAAAIGAEAAIALDAGQAGLAGTPGYRAPELDAGGVPTTSADVYALGVLLAELVTGARPGPGDEAAGVPYPLRFIVTACLAADPRDRPSARVVAAHLRRIGDERPPEVRTEPARAGLLLQQRTAVALVGTVALSVAVYFGLNVTIGSAGQTPAAAPTPAVTAPAPAASAVAAPTVAATPVKTIQVGNPVTEVRLTFAARLEIGTLFVAVRDGRAIAYLCDGDKVEVWFQGPALAGELALSSKAGATLTGSFKAGAATGSVTFGGRNAKFRIPSVKKPSGLYRAAGQVRDAQVKGGWIVLADGTQTGVLTVGGKPQPAPPLDTTTRTAGEGIEATAVDAESGEGF